MPEGCGLVPEASGCKGVLLRVGLRLTIGVSEGCGLGDEGTCAGDAVATPETAVAPAAVEVALAALRIFFHLGGSDVRE